MKLETPTVPVSAPEAYSFSSDVVMIAEPLGARAEAIRALRTHIVAQHVAEGRRGLAICAASSNAGATFTAVNLAVALSQIGVKTLLVDGDLRYPAVDRFILPPRTPLGLRQYLEDLEGQVGVDVELAVLDNLSVIYAGGAANNAQELLAGPRFATLLERCLRDFDVTIVDTPPANRCADARRISNLVGYSVIVAKRHESYVTDITALAAQLADDRAKIVGTVMNES
jgi:capsular exopolysaccharide synthesis family protein